MNTVQNILVTGNGFDLAHGLKTEYMDFIHCVEAAFAKKKEERSDFDTKLTELCNVNGFFRHFHFTVLEDPSWSSFEAEMTVILQALIRFVSEITEQQKDIEFDPTSFNVYGGIFTYRDLQVYKHFARIFEQIYDDPSGGMFKIRHQYITLEKILNKKEFIAEVKRELDSFTEALDLYLTESLGAARPHTLPQIGQIAPDYVINFNYTDTILAYGIPEDHVFYAKGRTGGGKDHLVLGVPDEGEDHAEWIRLKNYFQCLERQVGFIDQEKLYPKSGLGEQISVTVHYFGYSFPMEDAWTIRELAAAASKTVIYCKDREDYAAKMIQLFRILGKETLTKQIQNKSIEFQMM